MPQPDELPTDTILDTDPPGGVPLQPGPLKLMKALYLRAPQTRDLLSQMTPTELIDSCEKMRRDGLLQIVVKQVEGQKIDYHIVLTPRGSAAGWIAKHGR